MDKKSRWQRVAPFLVPALLFAVVTAVSAAAAVRQGEGHLVYSLDDAYIHMAMAKNLARHGVWGVNASGFASASSSLLWTALLAGCYLLFGVNGWAPFALNVLSCLAVLFIADLYWRRWGAAAWLRALGGVAIVLCVPLALLPLIGMEHSLHLLLSLWFAGAAVDLLLAPGPSGKSGRLALPLLAALLAASRYEGLFLVGVAALLLACRRMFARALATVAAAVLPLAGFSVLSLLSHGLALPNPVLLKAAGSRLSLLGTLLRFADRRDRLAWEQNPYFVALLGLAVLLALAALALLRKWRTPGFILPCLLAAMIVLHFHFGFSPGFWVYRYSAYLVAFAVFALVAFMPAERKLAIPWRALATGAALAALAWMTIANDEWREGIFPGREVARVRRNFLEHVGTACFIRAACPRGPVAVNDIGAVCFFADAEILDLYGLGNVEPLRFRSEPRARERADLDAWVRAKGARLAIVQLGWSDMMARLPRTWTEVGEVDLPLRGSKIGFFAVESGDGDALRQKLRSFYGEWWRPRHARLRLLPAT